jgi:hypothetical protein
LKKQNAFFFLKKKETLTVWISSDTLIVWNWIGKRATQLHKKKTQLNPFLIIFLI